MGLNGRGEGVYETPIDQSRDPAIRIVVTRIFAAIAYLIVSYLLRLKKVGNT